MKRFCKLAIIGLLLNPVKTRVLPHKVGLISQSEDFVCRVLLHTYYKHTREGLLEIEVVRSRNFFLIPGMACFNKCLLKTTASMGTEVSLFTHCYIGLGTKGKTVNRTYQGVITASVSMEIDTTFGEIKVMIICHAKTS